MVICNDPVSINLESAAGWWVHGHHYFARHHVGRGSFLTVPGTPEQSPRWHDVCCGCHDASATVRQFGQVAPRNAGPLEVTVLEQGSTQGKSLDRLPDRPPMIAGSPQSVNCRAY